MSFIVALRHANHTLRLIALVSIGALASITAVAVFGRDDTRHGDALETLRRAAQRFEARRPTRVPIGGEPVLGEAMDDYHWRCHHRHPADLPVTAEKLARLTAEERAALDTPAERAVIDRFVRGQRREDVGQSALPFDCTVDVFRRLKAVLASALIAESNGETDLAWRRAAALVRYADDSLGRAPIIITVLASAQATRAVALMADLAGQASGEQARRWRAEIAALRSSALDPADLDVALAVGEAAIDPALPIDGEWGDELAAELAVLARTATGDGPDIDVWCEEVGRDRPICDLREALTRDVTVLAAGLDAVALQLRDRRCEAVESRL